MPVTFLLLIESQYFSNSLLLFNDLSCKCDKVRQVSLQPHHPPGHISRNDIESETTSAQGKRHSLIKGNITIKGSQLERRRRHRAVPLACGGGDGHALGRVEDEADVVEGRGDEAPPRDVALPVLVLEGGLEREAGEEGPHGGDEELELGGQRGVVVLEDDVVVYHDLDVPHDLGVAPRRLLGHVLQAEGRGPGLEDAMRLGV